VQVTPPIANAMDGIIAATPSEQMKIERMRILISPNKLSTVNTAVATEVKAKANGPVGPDARSPGAFERTKNPAKSFRGVHEGRSHWL
jgi:hypothetical protein